MLKQILLSFITATFLVSSVADLWAEERGQVRRSQEVVPLTALVPAGTSIEIRLLDSISTRRNKSGDRYEAVLEKDLVVDGEILAPRKSLVIGKLLEVKSSGRVKGRARMSLTLIEMHVGEEPYPIQTNEIVVEAEGTKGRDIKRIGTGAGLGAIIGVITGGGAGLGSVIGSSTGTGGVLLTKGKEVEFKAEQKFNFRLEKDLEIKLP
ncbi:hypothetical protein MYX78_06745 [Acidobacteria bacterium AH-259-G07]|nr:hypothetical protein [Acidobacteria bacterium AH-259-G07]